MSKFVIGIVICLSFFVSRSVSALWLDCNNCDNAAMEKLVKSEGRSFGVGRHEVSVINFDQSIYQIFQVDVAKVSGDDRKGNRDEWRIDVSVIDNPMKHKIESDLRQTVKAIDDLLETIGGKVTIPKNRPHQNNYYLRQRAKAIDEFLATIGGKITLPKDGPYKTVGHALIDGPAFDAYLAHYINNEQNDLSRQLKSINLAFSERLSARASKMTAQSYAGLVASLPTQRMMILSAPVEFPDSSLLRVIINSDHHTVEGITIIPKTTQQAETADNQRVPLSGRTANGFSTTAQHEGADLTGIVEWFNSIGINTALGSRTGEGTSCRTVKIDCDEYNWCAYKLACVQ